MQSDHPHPLGANEETAWADRLYNRQLSAIECQRFCYDCLAKQVESKLKKHENPVCGKIGHVWMFSAFKAYIDCSSYVVIIGVKKYSDIVYVMYLITLQLVSKLHVNHRKITWQN